MSTRVTPSYPALNALINALIPNGDGTLAWGGANGLQSILYGLSDSARTRGALYVDNTGILSSLSGNDARFVIVRDVAWYAYDPTGSISPTAPNFPASDGGRWVFLSDIGKVRHEEEFGDSATLVFTIIHNLNTLLPTYQILNTLALPYGYDTSGVVAVTDANTITITYTSAPGRLQFTVIVKK